ncbi:hypothetical protein [Niallia sp. 03133]|uniref:hypothetical protein n=1 Tax=Niallia sp. 03133 TaxID=3458060 RepID=UPI004043E1E0
MDKKQIVLVMKGINVLIWVAWISSLIFGGLALYTTLKIGSSPLLLGRDGESINKQAGTLAEIIGIATGVLWLLRKAIVYIKNRGSLLKEWIRQLYMVIRKHHISLGLLTLFITFTHGFYFFLITNVNTNKGFTVEDTTLNFYSGIAAFISLVILALLGWYHHCKQKTKKNIKSKKMHMIFALVFGVLALIHIYLF